ncbi:MAG TPA: PEGA domain-containing protein, partial [Myxococcota bacterium]|nr:PEGA domain-containing protein [Myxococcota bacterium]
MRSKLLSTVLVAGFGLLIAGTARAQGGDDHLVWVGNESLIPVADGQARKAPPLREPAYLHVEADAADAEILLDNNLEFKGRAFQKFRSSRLVRVTVKIGGRGVVDGYVELVEREVVKFKVGYQRPSEAKTGAVTMISSPNGAEVYLDGVPVGQTPLTLRKVPVGNRQLALAYGSWTWQGVIT